MAMKLKNRELLRRKFFNQSILRPLYIVGSRLAGMFVDIQKDL